MSFTINKRLFCALLPAFILAVVIGTLHHETGHYLAAKWMGLTATLHYDYTRREVTGARSTMQQLLWFSWGGPLQTMFTGTVALLLLYALHHRKNLSLLSRYLLIFVAMFWVRQPVNFFLGGLYCIANKHWPEKGDEAKLSIYYHLPVWSINAATAVLGTVAIAIIIFRFVPATHRSTFWLAGIVGGAAGYFLWIVWLGKYVLP